MQSSLVSAAIALPAVAGAATDGKKETPAPNKAASGQETIAALREKRVYARAKRFSHECYNAVLDPRPGSSALAYLKVDDKRERLVCQSAVGAPEIELTDATYVLSPVFAGDMLFWVERIGKDWRMRAVSLDDPSKDKAFQPFQTAGRPMSLSTHTSGDVTWLAWEERQGKRTRVWISKIGKTVGKPIAVTDGSFNAYDPQCALSGGVLYVVYSAFVEGNYRIHIQKLTPDCKLVGKAQRVSCQSGACVYPSICPRTDGGVWFSYTNIDGLAGGYTQSLRHQAQQGFVHGGGMLFAGIYDGKRTWAPCQPPSVTAAVVGSAPAGHSRIYEDPSGWAWIVFSHHLAGVETKFASEDAPLARAAGPRHIGVPIGPLQERPCIALTMLTDKGRGWQAPVPLNRRTHLEAPASLSFEGSTVRIAFSEDARSTGWSQDGEYFDTDGELGVGIIQVGLLASGKPAYELAPYVIYPSPGGSIAEPALASRKAGDYSLAIGQTHQHSAISVCCRQWDREPHTSYRFQQDVLRLDFGCNTDHCYNMWNTERLIMRKMAEYYYFPGEFVAIPAYEWTGTGFTPHQGGPFGHMNPLYLEEEGDLEVATPADPDGPGSNPNKLWAMYEGKRILTPIHHPVDQAHWWNWSFFNADFMPIIEMFQSQRGSAEHPWAPGVTNLFHKNGEPWLVDILKQGKKLRFIASSDHGGIACAGVYVTQLTRTGLYEAFKAGRCCAFTTCSACNVDFSFNGSMMGQEVKASRGSFKLRAEAAQRIREVQIVRNGEDHAVIRGKGTKLEHTWNAKRRESGEFWYCRVILEEGDIAWTSPIWLV